MSKEETIRERIVREEREAQERRAAQLKAEREAREKAEAEARAKRRKAEAERKAKAEAEAKRRAEQAKRDEAARKKRNAELRAKEIERVEKQYVLFERAKAMINELIEAEGKGLNAGTTYRATAEKLMQSVDFNLNSAKSILMNPVPFFKQRGIAD